MTAKLLAVAAGGALGAVLRALLIGACIRLFPAFPWGTLAVNVSGSLAMGVVAVVLIERMQGCPGWLAPFLMTGVLGGFTTFSAFSLDAVWLIERGRIGAAAGYVLGSVALSVGAFWIGATLARRVVGS